MKLDSKLVEVHHNWAMGGIQWTVHLWVLAHFGAPILDMPQPIGTKPSFHDDLKLQNIINKQASYVSW